MVELNVVPLIRELVKGTNWYLSAERDAEPWTPNHGRLAITAGAMWKHSAISADA